MQSGALLCTASAREGSINPLFSVQRNPAFAKLPHFRAGCVSLASRDVGKCIGIPKTALIFM